MQISIIYRQFKKYIPVSAIAEKLISLILISGVLFLSPLSCSLQKQGEWAPVKLNITPATTALKSTDSELPAAIMSLINQADRYIDHKQWPKAISVLERALRINKRQPETWTRMAIAYKGKNELQQAIQMAKRSNSYAARNMNLKAYNWQLISNAYLKLNKLEQAQSAAHKSQKLLDSN